MHGSAGLDAKGKIDHTTDVPIQLLKGPAITCLHNVGLAMVVFGVPCWPQNTSKQTLTHRVGTALIGASHPTPAGELIRMGGDD